MINSVSSLKNYLPFLGNENLPDSQFSKALQSGDIDELKRLVSTSPNLLEKTSIHGDLPLSYAVKEKNHPLIQSLLDIGADPMHRDGQNISAMDQAILSKDDHLVAIILHHLVNKDVDSIHMMLQDKIYLKKAKAAYDEIQRAMKNNLKDKSSALQGAILGKDISVNLKINPAALEIFALSSLSNGDNLFHQAISLGSIEILKQLCESFGDKLNQSNKSGFTPLHYAVASERMDMIQLMISRGANSGGSDVQPVPPLALLAAIADKRDPLKVGKLDMFIFFSSLAMCSIPFITNHPYSLRSFADQSLSLYPYLAVVTSLELCYFAAQNLRYLNSFKTWKGYFCSLAAMTMVGAVLPLGNGFRPLINAYTTSRLALNALNGLSTCWKNQSLGKGRALFKALVTHAPSAKMTFDLGKGLINEYYGSNPAEELVFSNKQKEIQAFNDRVINQCLNNPSPLECMKKSWEIVESCVADAESESCKLSGDHFMERMNFWDHRSSYDKKDNCFRQRNNYFHACRRDFYSDTCLKSEELYKEAIGFTSESSPKPQVSCTSDLAQYCVYYSEEIEKAKALLGCNETDTQTTCKKKWTNLMRLTHPDKKADAEIDIATTLSSQYNSAMCLLRTCIYSPNSKTNV